MPEQMARQTGFNGWLAAHPWIAYILIFLFLVYIYNKVFRVRRLPILKELIVLILIAVGAFILLLFQIDIGLPIVLCLGVAIGLMLIVRIRYAIAGRKNNKKD